ncbi:MAG: hypothetical protein AB7Q97_17800 [Gammaproteobacteria bacterium]
MKTMLMIRRVAWWYWAITAVLLGAGLAGRPEAFRMAIALTAWQCLHALARERRAGAFPVQVRLAYLALLCASQWPPLAFAYWIWFGGTLAMVLFGYCALARTLSLMPWNRREPLAAALVLRTFAAPPVEGSILQGLPAPAAEFRQR